MTLIEVRGGDGSLRGRCDSRCYNATTPDCDCVCGGRNHGKGLEKAAEQTHDMYEQWVEEYAKRLGLTDYSVGLAVQLHQLELGL